MKEKKPIKAMLQLPANHSEMSEQEREMWTQEASKKILESLEKNKQGDEQS